MRLPREQLFRYLVVGGVNTAVGYATFAALNWVLTDRIPLAYLAANAASNVVAISVAFLGYKLFVFRTRGSWLAEYLRCWVVYGGSALLGFALMPPLVSLARWVLPAPAWAPYVAQAVLVPTAIGLSFVGHRTYSFRVRAGGPARGDGPGGKLA